MLIKQLLAQLASASRRRCRMCGGEPAERGRWCTASCREQYLDFYSPGY